MAHHVTQHVAVGRPLLRRAIAAFGVTDTPHHAIERGRAGLYGWRFELSGAVSKDDRGQPPTDGRLG